MSPEHRNTGRLFVNGEQRVLDLKPFLARQPADRRVGLPLFLLAKVPPGGVVWPGTLDGCPDPLRRRSRPPPKRGPTGSGRGDSPVLCFLILLCLLGCLPGCGGGGGGGDSSGPVSLADNQAPTCRLVSPAGPATFPAGERIVLAAVASDADGSVLRVDFFAGTTLLGSANPSSASIGVSSLTAGTHLLAAHAFDDRLAEGMSPVVPVSVVPASAPPGIVLLFIGDGMGPEQVKAARWFSRGVDGRLAMVTTTNADGGTTDSAAAATAIACGTKTRNGVVALGVPGTCSGCSGDMFRTPQEFGNVSPEHRSWNWPAAWGVRWES
ncbi:MAG: hypothetical protein GX442_12750 [Candidatus Riflebacteria bacterium]|nr:hypothetical protein [Candidatus Riflebacteria bacterium]